MLACIYYISHSTWSWLAYILPAGSNLILVFLGVMLSLPKFAQTIEDTPKYKKILAFACLLFAFVGFGFEVSQRRSGDQINKQLLEDTGKALTKTDVVLTQTRALVTSTQEMLSSIGLMQPQLTATNEHVERIDAQLNIARKRNDAAQVAALQAEKQESLTSLLSMTPGVIAALNDKYSQCFGNDIHFENLLGTTNPSEDRQPIKKARADKRKECSDSVRPLLKSANYIREEILRRIPNYIKTEDDEKAALIFERAVAGDFIEYEEISAAALYLQKLSHKFPPQPPTAISATFR
jgi:hypothetical protein